MHLGLWTWYCSATRTSALHAQAKTDDDDEDLAAETWTEAGIVGGGWVVWVGSCSDGTCKAIALYAQDQEFAAEDWAEAGTGGYMVCVGRELWVSGKVWELQRGTM